MITVSARSALLLLLAFTAALQACSQNLADVRQCFQLSGADPVEFDGRVLVEIPDIRSPEMRRANLLLSSGCFDQAAAELDRFLAERPDDPEGLYVAARFAWIARGTAFGEEVIQALIDFAPAFISGHVLLAGIRIDQNRYDEASEILDRLEPLAPEDMWIWMNRIRIEAATDPNSAVRDKLLEIQADRRFPPNVRETAGQQLRYTQYVTPEQYGMTYALSLEYDSGQSLGCKLANYSAWLMENQNRVDDAIAVVEPHLDDFIDCPGWIVNGRDMLAYAYLVRAAEIDSAPSDRNAEFVARARAAVDGNFSRLSSWLVGRPRERLLEPCLFAGLEAGSTDAYGRTRICNGVLLLQPDTVRIELERGANPNGRCENGTLVTYLTLMGGRNKVPERQAILTELLEHGARPSDVRYCRDPANGVCSTALAPIFEQYGLLEAPRE